MLPERIGGKAEEKPALLIGVGLAKKRRPGMPERIGGPSDDYESEGSEESISHEQALTDAARSLIDEFQRMKPSPERVAAALKAAFYACDAEPHDEGEHTEEEESE